MVNVRRKSLRPGRNRLCGMIRGLLKLISRMEEYDAELKCESFQFAFDSIEEHSLTIVSDSASRIVTMACAGDAGGNVYASLHKLWIPVSGAEGHAIDEEARIDELVDAILGRGGI